MKQNIIDRILNRSHVPSLTCVIVIVIVFLTTTCIEPFNVDIPTEYYSIVVDAFITDDSVSNYVIIKEPTYDTYAADTYVSGAHVSVTDDLGTETIFRETDHGFYYPDNLSFKGQVGRAYTLHIKTSDGNRYESYPSMMYPVSEISNVKYEQDIGIAADGSIVDGIKIIAESDSLLTGGYQRWTFTETWKINVQEPIRETKTGEPVDIPLICWATNKSNDINVHEISSSNEDLHNVTINFLNPSESDRFLDRYCIEVNQLSVSQEEYEYWRKIEKLGSLNQSVFAEQPYTVNGNIFNLDNSGKSALGYFQVSAKSFKRLYINVEDVIALDYNLFSYNCSLQSAYFLGYDGLSFRDMVYNLETNGYVFIYAYSSGWTYVKEACAKCHDRASVSPPSFWVDK